MENYNSATAMEKNVSIIKALADFPNSLMKTKNRKKQLPEAANGASLKVGVQREAGDHLNVFMLCTLVNKSAKQIKAGAEKRGAYLPMTSVLRKVLSAYRLAAKDKHGPLASSNPDVQGLADLNRQILRNLTK
jgi:hypothetical protein